MHKKNKKVKHKDHLSPLRREPGVGTVKAKKHLGQHFLKDEDIAKKIANTLTLEGYKNVVEIGPGMGMLTKYILQKDINVIAMDLDRESIEYLNTHFLPGHKDILRSGSKFKIVGADFFTGLSFGELFFILSRASSDAFVSQIG